MHETVEKCERDAQNKRIVREMNKQKITDEETGDKSERDKETGDKCERDEETGDKSERDIKKEKINVIEMHEI